MTKPLLPHKDVMESKLNLTELCFLTSPILGVVRFLKGFTLSIVQGAYLGVRKIHYIRVGQEKISPESAGRAARWERDARNNSMNMLRGIVNILNFVTLGGLNLMTVPWDNNTTVSNDTDRNDSNEVRMNPHAFKTRVLVWINKPVVEHFLKSAKNDGKYSKDLKKLDEAIEEKAKLIKDTKIPLEKKDAQKALKALKEARLEYVTVVTEKVRQMNLYLSKEEKTKFADEGKFVKFPVEGFQARLDSIMASCSRFLKKAEEGEVAEVAEEFEDGELPELVEANQDRSSSSRSEHSSE